MYLLLTFLRHSVYIMTIYGVFKRWGKHEANLKHSPCTCIFNTFASCLLHRVNTAYSCPLYRPINSQNKHAHINLGPYINTNTITSSHACKPHCYTSMQNTCTQLVQIMSREIHKYTIVTSSATTQWHSALHGAVSYTHLTLPTNREV